MLSKNNTYLKKKKIANQAQRFGLRKLSIGTVSVLLGTLLFMGNSQASADTTTDTRSTGTEAKTASATTDLNASQVALSSTGSQAAASESAATASQATSSSMTATSQAATNSATAASDTTTDTTKTSTPATSTAAQSKTAVKATVTATPTAETNASIATAEASAATTTNSQETSDDAISAEGKITDEGKTKGLTDSDVTPGMSNANGASVVADESNIPSGYKADPADGRYTFGIVSLGPTVSAGSKNSTYNKVNGTNYYIRLSVDKDDSGDVVHLQVVDADTDTVIESYDLTPSKTAVDITCLKNEESVNRSNEYYTALYTENISNGLLISKTISINTNYSGRIIGSAYDATGTSKGSTATTLTFNLPTEAILATQYIAKDAAGNETILAEYDINGRVSYEYTSSGVRTFKGYDLVEEPAQKKRHLK